MGQRIHFLTGKPFVDASPWECSCSRADHPWRAGQDPIHRVLNLCSCCHFFFGWHHFHFVAFACMSNLFPVHWTAFDVTSEADFVRWEESAIWQRTVVFSLGRLRSNLSVFLFLDQSDRGQLRLTCFAFAVEVTDCYRDVAVLTSE